MSWRKPLTIIGFVVSVIAAAAVVSAAFGNTPSTSGITGGRKISGRIVSEYGPVSDARVRIAGEENYTLTDRQGMFELATGHAPVKSLKVTAGKDGWFNNAKMAYPMGDAGEIFLNPIPRRDNPAYRFISPTTCSRCHVKVTRYWDKSKMAHTTSNPKVLNMYYGTDSAGRTGIGPGYRRDNPKDEGNCATCHAPSVAASNFRKKDLKAALWSPRTEWDGISCDYCHKIRNVVKKADRPSGFAPVLKRQTPARGNSIMVFGPYDDVVNGPMAASYSPIFDKGRYCSTCHSQFKKLPEGSTWDRERIYTDEEWKGFGLKPDSTFLPIQTTYQEWKQWQDGLQAGDSNKGKKCQDCHMSWRKEMLPYDNYVIDGHARDMWGTHRSPRDIRPHHFDGATAIQLKTALSMEIEGEVAGNILTVKVYITNTNGGHWVPTGETMRSVMLLIQATDSAEKPLKMVGGSRLPDWTGNGKIENGDYAGLPGAVFARVLQDGNGNLHVPFWKATAVAADTRIRPKKTVTLEFRFAVEDPGDEPVAEAQLIYRPVVKPLANLKNWEVEDIPITSSVW